VKQRKKETSQRMGSVELCFVWYGSVSTHNLIASNMRVCKVISCGGVLYLNHNAQGTKTLTARRRRRSTFYQQISTKILIDKRGGAHLTVGENKKQIKSRCKKNLTFSSGILEI